MRCHVRGDGQPAGRAQHCAAVAGRDAVDGRGERGPETKVMALKTIAEIIVDPCPGSVTHDGKGPGFFRDGNITASRR